MCSLCISHAKVSEREREFRYENVGADSKFLRSFILFVSGGSYGTGEEFSLFPRKVGVRTGAPEGAMSS